MHLHAFAWPEKVPGDLRGEYTVDWAVL
jgi:hypothetical protein